MVMSSFGGEASGHGERACRVCLTDSGELHPISTAHLSMIFNCTGIRANIGEGYPEVICKKCNTDLLTSYMFKVKFIATNTLLENAFSRLPRRQIKTETLEIDLKPSHIDTRFKIKREENPTDDYLPRGSIANVSSAMGYRYHSDSSDDDESNDICNIKREPSSQTSNYPLLCDHCEAVFVDKNALIKHMFKHAVNDQTSECFVCTLCDCKFKNKRRMEAHRHMHFRPLQYCKYCNYNTRLHIHMYRHMKTHLGLPKDNVALSSIGSIAGD
ncbi:uncharacterized protein LOC143914493 [Arctopsyche grandis]|uniref:uncharacterized protein LOC143914493 n=1 Tax=Arctopsyche grandis TaxID=121162 RepID=UPI00406D72FE